MGLPRFYGQGQSTDTRQFVFPKRRRTEYTKWLVILAIIGLLYLARSFFMPLVLAVLLTLILLPPVHMLARHRIPQAVGAAFVLLCFVSILGISTFLLSGPVSLWARRSPEIAAKVALQVQRLTRPLQELKSKTTAPTAAGQPAAPEITVRQTGGLLNGAVTRAGASLALTGTTFILLYFLLASGDRLFQSALAQISDLRQKTQVMEIGEEVRHEVSRYLLTISTINVVEGALIAGGLALTGMPTPLLWGAMHAVLNFIPYIGSITGLAITAIVALISFPTISHALIAPGIYLAVMILDNFASPMVLGQRLVLNPALVFISLMFWGWLWGIVGILVAIPILMVAKIICDTVPSLSAYGRIISGSVEPQHPVSAVGPR